MSIEKKDEMRYNRMQDAGPTVTFARANQKVPPLRAIPPCGIILFFNKEKEL